MTEHTLQALADAQGAILGVLENYLKLYDRQNRELEDLRQNPRLSLQAVRHSLSLGQAGTMSHRR